MQKATKQLTDKLTKVIASPHFLWFVIGLFVLNALWIAFSIRYPLPYDENFHFPIIQLLSNQLSPLVDHPERGIDGLTSLLYGSKPVFYHYLMSFPYRLIASFTQVVSYQIILLRTINIAMVAVGLWVFSRLFSKIGIKQIFINVGLLLFTLLPIVPFAAAHINYDNMLFALTAVYLLLCIHLIRQTQVNWITVAGVVAVGCLASLTKPTFLPIFAVSVAYLGVLLWRRGLKKVFSQFVKSLKKSPKSTRLLVAIALVATLGLFSSVHIRNLVQYGSPKPNCSQVLSKQRCLELDRRGVITRAINAERTASQHPTVPIEAFTQQWFDNVTTFGITAANPTTGSLVAASPPPIILNLIFFGIFIGISAVLYSWRSLQKSTSWYFLLTVAAVLVIALYFVNITGYYRVHRYFANQPRYLLSAMPIVIVMSVMAVNFILRKARWLKLAAFIVVLLLFTQGGGAITTILRSDNTWYWQNPTVIKANHAAKKVLHPLVYEGKLLD